MALRTRQRLHHTTPPWLSNAACFFVTICTSPRRLNQLARPEVAPAILDSVAHNHYIGTWWVHLWLLMPDHVHSLIAVAPDHTLRDSIRAWKSWQTKTHGIQWQTGFFDHRLRSDESFEEKANYIRQNPVRAQLVVCSENWPHQWSAKI